MIPQLIILSLYVLNIGIHLAKHGEREVKNYNVLTTTVGAAIEIVILYYGGFWEVFLK